MSIKERELLINNSQQNPEATGIQTVQDVGEALRECYYSGSGARSKLMDDLRRIEKDGYWRPEIGERVVEVGNTISLLAAERLIENCLPLLKNPQFDFISYSDLVIRAYRRFGARVGAYFCLSYEDIFGLGINPYNYFDWVSGAVEAGGKYFAAWYAYGLLEVVKVGGEPEVFRSCAHQVYKIGGLKVAKPFILNAPGMLNAEFSLPEFSDLTVRATEALGRKIAPWVVRNMAGLAEFDYAPNEFLGDTEKLLVEKGEKAASWYASGFTWLLQAKWRLEREIRGLEKHLQEHPEKQKEYEGSLRNFQRANEILDVLGFEERYLRLLNGVGQNAATFYSLAAKGLDFREDSVRSFMEMPEKIIDFSGRMSKKVFNTAMWFVLKINQDPRGVVRLLGNIAQTFERIGEKATIEAIKYTYGCGVRNKSYCATSTLKLPFLKTGGGLVRLGEPPNYEEPTSYEEWEQILLHAEFMEGVEEIYQT